MFAQFSSAQIVSLDITQRPNAQGILEYEVSGFASTVSTFSSLSLNAPDGTLVGPSTVVEGLDFQQLENRFFGDWTVGANTVFSLKLFELDDVFSEVPTFISSDNIALSGSSFLLDWEYPSGLNDFSGTSLESTSIGPLAIDDIEFVDSTSANVLLGAPLGGLPSTPTDFLFTAGNSSDLDDFISLGGESNLFVDADFTTLSQEFAVSVVPEPATTSILPVAMIILACLRRREKTV